MTERTFLRAILALLAALAALVAAPASACTVSASVAGDLGSYSPAAVKAAAVPALRSRAGLSCAPAVLVLLGGNYIRARVHSDNGLKLQRSGGVGTIGYALSADPNGTVPFAQDGTVDYMQNNLLNLLGLLGGSSAELPFFVRPAGGALPPVGTYTDRITVSWDWYLCPGLGALFVCVGTPDQGRATAVVDVTLDVSAKALTVATRSVTTWDPVNGTANPRALPGSKRRATVTVANPDLVAIDGNSVALVVPIAAGQRIALDGDGTGAGGVITLAEGTPASTLTLAYAAPGSTADGVDFSADGGVSWAFAPVAGNAASEAQVTTLRLRPQGAMAARSSFSVSFPTAIR